MAVPLLDLKLQYAQIKDEALKVTEEIYASQYFILGPKVEAFEKDFAAYCQAKHAIGVSSGTDALLVALMVLDVKPGDEVIVPAYSFFATAGVVARLGATPVFVDVDPASFNIDPAQIEKSITKKTKAIIPVHLYGQLAEMDAINAIAQKHGIPVIEDSAQAVGAEYKGKRTGALGAMACFSFFPSKNLGAFGDAGAVTTDDDALAEKLKDYRVHGMRPKYYHHSVGGNFRIDALQAAILHIKLRHLETWHAGRQKNAEIYRELFAKSGKGDQVVLPPVLPERRHIFNQFIIRFKGGTPARDKAIAALKAASIGHDIYYPLTLPEQECFKDLPSFKQTFPESERAARETIAVPIYPELTREQIGEVVGTITGAL